MADNNSSPRVEEASPPWVEDGADGEGADRMEVEETVTGSHRDTLPKVPSGPEKEEAMLATLG